MIRPNKDCLDLLKTQIESNDVKQTLKYLPESLKHFISQIEKGKQDRNNVYEIEF
jgi:hypothetical protein